MLIDSSASAFSQCSCLSCLVTHSYSFAHKINIVIQTSDKLGLVWFLCILPLSSFRCHLTRWWHKLTHARAIFANSHVKFHRQFAIDVGIFIFNSNQSISGLILPFSRFSLSIRMQHTLRTVAQFCAFTFSFKYLMNVTHTAARWIRDWFAKANKGKNDQMKWARSDTRLSNCSNYIPKCWCHSHLQNVAACVWCNGLR